MEENLKREVRQVLASNQNNRDFMARNSVLNLYEYLTNQGFSPMKKMSIIEAFVYYPLFLDGPINEKELHFIKVALNDTKTTVEVANIIAKQHLNMKETLFEVMKKLSPILIYDVLCLVFIGLISDNNDDMNDIESNFFDELFLVALDAI